MTDITTIWKQKDYDRQNAYDFVEALEIPLPIATVLSSRGINTPKKYNKFVNLNKKIVKFRYFQNYKKIKNVCT